MINIRTIRKLVDGDGLTLKNGRAIAYKTGYQVADYGVEVTTAQEAIKAVRAYNGNCGVWFENGIYYIDHSFRVSGKKNAMEKAREYNQISVYNWHKQNLIYTKEYFSI